MTENVEIPLAGGSINAVVRVGDTVRRPTGAWTPAVHHLLRYLTEKGFDGVPRPLGVDDRGREILTFIDGEPALRAWPERLRNDDGLVDLIRLLLDYHEAVRDYRPRSDARWFGGSAALAPGQVIIHGDIGPWNTLWRQGRPVAIIDWDFAGPGDPLDDVAELALYAVPMRDDAHAVECGFEEAPDRGHRLRVVCATYGHGATPADLVDRAVIHWQKDVADIEEHGPKGVEPWAGFFARGLADEGRGTINWLETNRHLLVS